MMTKSLDPFYRLPYLDDEYRWRIRWVEEPRLRRNLIPLLNELSQPTERNLLYRLIDQVQDGTQDPLIHRHLFAYTAHYISQPVRRIQIELKSLNRITDPDHFFKDQFQILLESASHPQDFYQNYQIDRTPGQYWLPSAKTYIRSRMEGILCDNIRKMPGLNTYKRSDQGLVVRASRTRIHSALVSNGYQEPKLAQYMLLWDCFHEHRKLVPKASPRSSPTDERQPRMQAQTNFELYRIIANRYNQLRSQLPIPSHLNPPITEETAATQINQMGQAIRLYIDPRIIELDQPSNDNQSLLTTMSAPTPIPDSDVSETDLEAFHQFLHQVLTALPPQTQQIPMLLKGLTLSQKAVGQELGINQSTVGRHFKDLLKQLTLQLVQWSIETHDFNPSSEMLLILQQALSEVLEDYYASLVDAFFLEGFETQSADTQALLRLYYVCNSPLTQIAPQLNQPLSILEQQLTDSVQQLRTILQEAIELRIGHQLIPGGSAQQQLIPTTETRLLTAPYTY